MCRMFVSKYHEFSDRRNEYGRLVRCLSNEFGLSKVEELTQAIYVRHGFVVYISAQNRSTTCKRISYSDDIVVVVLQPLQHFDGANDDYKARTFQIRACAVSY